ncbi:peptidylprolyl isomerase [Actinomarinicola tropica]|uniref:PpiC domain-containing protein n=1 Tax=Actinomarinicola tropica TaxID=2789776 RepID=A0A5Q2RKJ5_9ACTN|nr:peptidylprolyl isomerase [Actinomarinicola tropica]QGG96004.1 hypothetical protein GH723_13350 [Actinomarinicola tropica]
MTRLRPRHLLALAVLPALLLTACGGDGGVAGRPAAVTLNGEAVSDAEFRDLLGHFDEDRDFSEAFGTVNFSVLPGDAEGRLDSAFVAEILELHILFELMGHELDDRGLEVTEADIEEGRTAWTSAIQSATQQGATPEVITSLTEAPEAVVDWYAEGTARARVLSAALEAEVETAEVTDDDVRAFYDDNPQFFEGLVCSSHVLVETEAEAVEVLEQLEGGADIADVAAERSIDPSAATNGGDLGCSDPARFVPPFAAALNEGEVGEYTGPVESEFGFHVILVRARGDIFDEVATDIRAELESQAGPGNALGAWLEEAVSSAEVSISSRYGTWDAEAGEITPPEGPAGETPTLVLE